jgi:hypothetical protein
MTKKIIPKISEDSIACAVSLGLCDRENEDAAMKLVSMLLTNIFSVYVKENVELELANYYFKQEDPLTINIVDSEDNYNKLGVLSIKDYVLEMIDTNSYDHDHDKDLLDVSNALKDLASTIDDSLQSAKTSEQLK